MAPARPPRTVIQSPRFARAVKRLHPKEKLALDDEVKATVKEPLRGEPKVGALKGVRVVKYKVAKAQSLMAYTFDDKRNVIELVDLGSHENFYRDLQEYLDSR